jgi:cytidyltransferase-like protein
MDKNQTKEVQNAVLGLYKAFKQVCDDNGLRFFAIGGTAIGAVRHKGFIPWDDDIDVAMPRIDYEKFIELSKRMSKGIHFVDYVHRSDTPLLVGRVYSENTTLVPAWSITEPDKYNGVALDIMPLDGVSDNLLAYKIYRLIARSMYAMVSVAAHSGRPKLKRSLKSYLLHYGTPMFKPFLNSVTLKSYLLKLNKKHTFDNSRFLARTWWFSSHDGMHAAARYSKEDFESYIELPFEDTMMRMPVGYDNYLNSVYPGYMKLPPEHKRVARHSSGGIVDMNRPYGYYRVKEKGLIVGYTAGCYDMFHVGHLNLLKRAKENSDYLIVGVNSDAAMYSYKKKYPVIPEDERMSIIAALEYVDEVVLVNNTDKLHAYNLHQYDVIFVGDDHKNEPAWVKLDETLSKNNSKVHYFNYTPHISSSKLRIRLDNKIESKN